MSSEPLQIERASAGSEDNDLEDVELSNERFLQLLVFASACFMSTQVRRGDLM